MTASEPNLPDDTSDVEEISNSSGRLRVTLEITVAILVLVAIYYIVDPKEEVELPPLQQQEIDPIIRSQIEAARDQPAKEPAAADPAQVEKEETGLKESVNRTGQAMVLQPQAEGEAAREIIAAQRSGSESRPLSEIIRLATEYQQEGRVIDAYLLWFYAARQGDGEAAFALASLYDPNHFKQGNSLLTEADPTQAHKWYKVAAQQSVPQASERLSALRRALEAQAKAGDMTASRLLLNWQ
jgi:TPR repeat protein